MRCSRLAQSRRTSARSCSGLAQSRRTSASDAADTATERRGYRGKIRKLSGLNSQVLCIQNRACPANALLAAHGGHHGWIGSFQTSLRFTSSTSTLINVCSYSRARKSTTRFARFVVALTTRTWRWVATFLCPITSIFCRPAIGGPGAAELDSGLALSPRKKIIAARFPEAALAGRFLRSSPSKSGKLCPEMGLREDESGARGLVRNARSLALPGGDYELAI